MSGPWDEISGGSEPQDDRPLRRPLLPSWSPTTWMAGHRRIVAVVVVAVVASGLWAWQRAHPTVLTDSVHVRVDPSEYFLPGTFDVQGRASLLMLLDVDVSAGVAGPVRLVALDGGGISADPEHEVLGSSAKLTVTAQLSCDDWAGGQGVQVRFLVGPGAGQAVTVPLETDRSSPLGAPATAPCDGFEKAHPLRLDVFSSVLESSDPIIRTTWTVVNRSDVPITLADEVAIDSDETVLPLVPLSPTETTVVAAHETATLSRDIAVDSCVDPQPVDPSTTTVLLTGTTGQPLSDSQPVVQLALPDPFVAQLARAAQDACRGAPDLSGTTVTLVLHRAPPGHGRASLSVDGQVRLPGVWTAAIGDLSGIDSERHTAVGGVQHLQGPAPLALSASWTVHTCNSVLASPADSSVTVALTVSGLRTYPYVLPVTILGRTSCTPEDVRN